MKKKKEKSLKPGKIKRSSLKSGKFKWDKRYGDTLVSS